MTSDEAAVFNGFREQLIENPLDSTALGIFADWAEVRGGPYLSRLAFDARCKPPLMPLFNPGKEALGFLHTVKFNVKTDRELARVLYERWMTSEATTLLPKEWLWMWVLCYRYRRQAEPEVRQVIGTATADSVLWRVTSRSKLTSCRWEAVREFTAEHYDRYCRLLWIDREIPSNRTTRKSTDFMG